MNGSNTSDESIGIVGARRSASHHKYSDSPKLVTATMQFSSIALVLLSGGCSTARALVETNVTSEFASFEYIAPELQQVSQWDITERPSNHSLTGEGGDKGSSIEYVDSRSGKTVVFFPKVGDASILPGDGVGNRLLWSVGTFGTSHDEGHGPLTDHRMLSEAAEEACKMWITDHQDLLGISVEELFAPGTVRTATHPDGDIQLSLTRTYKGIVVNGSRVAITIVAGNIVTIAVEQWGDIATELDVVPTITADDALNAMSTHTGHALIAGDESCASELQILTLVNNDDSSIDLSASLRGATSEPVQAATGYKHILIWKVCPKFDGQGEAHLFKGYVNAHTKQIMEFKNTVDMIEVEGGVYPYSNDGIIPGGQEVPNW